MNSKKILDVIGTIILFMGFFLAFLPHAFHNAVGLEEQAHLYHVIFGMAFVIIALGIFIWNSKNQ